MKKFNYSTDIKGFNKLNKGQQFFVSKFIDFARELYNKGEKELQPLIDFQGKNIEFILNQIAKIMLKYNVKDDKLNLNNVEQLNLFNKIDKQLNNIYSTEAKKESTTLKNSLSEICKDKYNINSYLLSQGINFNLKKISDKNLKRILNTKIKGKNFSNRIWNNKDAIAKKLKFEIREFLNGNTSVNDIEKKIKDIQEVNSYCSQRLIRNEICRVQNEANEQFFKDNDGEYLLYSATLDNHTCSICKGYDGKVYKVNENRPKLPIHVNDRCTYILLPDKDYRPTTRLDNQSKETIDYTTYEEWAKKQNI